MRSKFYKIAQAVGVSLALAFSLSCSGGDDLSNGDNNGGVSSPSVGSGSSSSSVPSSSSIDFPSSSSVPTQTITYGPSVPYDGEEYQTVVIGSQTWMARNLNYATEDSRCYDDSETNCNKYGRLYNFTTAKTVCPTDWHLPSKIEWNELISYIESDKGCTNCAAKHLKTRSDWNGGNGTDDYGFSAFPGGYGDSDGLFYDVGDYSYWWGNSEGGAHYIYIRGVGYIGERSDSEDNGKGFLRSVRCVQD